MLGVAQALPAPPTGNLGSGSTAPLTAVTLRIPLDPLHPSHPCISLSQAERLRGAGAGGRGAAAAVCAGPDPRGQGVEAGLRGPLVVHGLRAQVGALPSTLGCSLWEEKSFPLLSSSREVSLVLAGSGCTAVEGWGQSPSCSPGCVLEWQTASGMPWCPPRGLSDETAWLGLT